MAKITKMKNEHKYKKKPQIKTNINKNKNQKKKKKKRTKITQTKNNKNTNIKIIFRSKCFSFFQLSNFQCIVHLLNCFVCLLVCLVVCLLIYLFVISLIICLFIYLFIVLYLLTCDRISFVCLTTGFDSSCSFNMVCNDFLDSNTIFLTPSSWSHNIRTFIEIRSNESTKTPYNNKMSKQ
jgi:hypothetical protein